MATIGVTISSATIDSLTLRKSDATGEAATPARKINESPGKKKPTSSPVSAKMIAQTPNRPRLWIRSLGLRMLPSDSTRARLFSAVSTATKVTGATGSGKPGSGDSQLAGSPGRDAGLLDLQQAALVPLLVVGRLAAAQAEQPLGQQQVDHRRHVDHQGADPDIGDLLRQLVNFDGQAQRGGHHGEVLAPAFEQPQAGTLDELQEAVHQE